MRAEDDQTPELRLDHIMIAGRVEIPFNEPRSKRIDDRLVVDAVAGPFEGRKIDVGGENLGVEFDAFLPRTAFEPSARLLTAAHAITNRCPDAIWKTHNLKSSTNTGIYAAPTWLCAEFGEEAGIASRRCSVDRHDLFVRETT